MVTPGKALGWLWLVLMASVEAAEPPPWRETAEKDLLGPKVDLTAEIVSQVQDQDYTCFLLHPYSNYYDYTGAQDLVIACNPGYFTQPDFAPGRTVGVAGNLGAAAPRRIGAQVYSYPIIAGAIITPRREPSPPYGYPGPYYPYYDPYWDPFWPHRPFSPWW
jgi:hypothetical protein